ncbi:MAG: dTDP-4-dehydrorhamnose reductase [Pseudomonadota bacterium]
MKALLFGTDGQLGLEILRRSKIGAGGMEIEARGMDEADFTDPAACVTWVEKTDADVVINASAYTAVDKAEEQEALALQINGTTPGLIAAAASKRDLPLVHVSTDYVFDGSGETPFLPDHPTGPLGAYGRTKLVGEEGVRGAGGAHAILRTSWVVSAHGHNFVKTMLKLGAARDRLTIVADQIGGPTPAAALADACLAAARGLVADPDKTGTYHVSGGPDVSWADFAREIFAQAGLAPEVVDIPSSDYPTPAKRPFNSRMDNTSFEAAFGLPRPDWKAGLTEILRDLDALART